MIGVQIVDKTVPAGYYITDVTVLVQFYFTTYRY